MKQNVMQKAYEFAALAHGDQKRKYTGEPYAIHLIDVAFYLTEADMPPTVVAAGYLHDVLEDTAVTEEELRAEFGPLITGFVKEVTDVSKPEDGNRSVRKKLDLDHLAQSSPAGAAIKLADLISNAKDIVKHDHSFARVYLKEKLELLKVLTHGPDVLYRQAMMVLAESLISLLETEKAERDHQ